MIRYQEMVPDFYIEKSRDFQILCRMYDFVLNSAKYNIDSMQSLTDTRRVKDTVLPLLGNKLGIYDKEAYLNRQMLEALPIAIKYKGSLKSVKILLNAFLDSMDIFDTALALHSKDEETAKEISDMLNRKIQPFSLVIIFSSFPNLTNLHVLNEYLKMVLPTGMLVEYAFAVRKTYLDKFKYKEYVFLFYTNERTYEDEPMKIPMTGLIVHNSESVYELITQEMVSRGFPSYTPVLKVMTNTATGEKFLYKYYEYFEIEDPEGNPYENSYYEYDIEKEDYKQSVDKEVDTSKTYYSRNCYFTNNLIEGKKMVYSYKSERYGLDIPYDGSTFSYVGTTNIKTRKEFVTDKKLDSITFTIKHTAVPIPPDTVPRVYRVELDANSGIEIGRQEVQYEASGTYTFLNTEEDVITYVEYSYNKTEEFVKKLNEEDFDVNSVSIGTVMSRDQVE